MIAVDISTLVAYLAGAAGRDIEVLDRALAHNQAHLPPAVVTEMLGASKAPESLDHLILALPFLGTAEGSWERAGRLRRRILARSLRAPLADALICQSCLDHDTALVTRDGNFKPFAKYCGLKLA